MSWRDELNPGSDLHQVLYHDDGEVLGCVLRVEGDPSIYARRTAPIGSVQNLSHIWSGDGFGLRDLRLIERPHVHVALG